MSEARDKYYELKKEVDKYHDGFRGGIHEYVSELESEKTELLEFIKNYMQCISSFNVKGNIEKLYKDGFKLLKKHGVEI